MKKIILLLILSLAFSGCFLFDENESENLALPLDGSEMQNINTVSGSEEIVDDATEDAVNTNESIINEDEQTSEEVTAEDVEREEGPALEDVFQGTWWLYMKYTEMQSVSEVEVRPGKYDSHKHLYGTMMVMQSDLYDIEADETYHVDINDELVDYEIDGAKIRINTEDAYLYGRITLDNNKSYASGDFTTTLGTGTWYMTNKSDNSDWDQL